MQARGEHTKQEAVVIDADVMRWLEANQTSMREGRHCDIGGGVGSGSGSGSGCGGDSGNYCGTGSGSVSSSQQVSASLAVLDYGVLRLVMKFLPRKEWCPTLPTMFAGARRATMEGRRNSKDKERHKTRFQAAQLNNPWYCAVQPLKGATLLNC